MAESVVGAKQNLARAGGSDILARNEEPPEQHAPLGLRGLHFAFCILNSLDPKFPPANNLNKIGFDGHILYETNP